MIILPPEEMSEYVCIPRGFTREYLQEQLRRTLDCDVTISRCKCKNLCATNDMRVSNSGATVLHLATEFTDGRVVDLALKILSPDSINLNKVDRRFDARQWETGLMGWWGKQGLSQIPIVYDVRSNPGAREYWILHEYFPHVGHSKGDQTVNFEMQKRLMEHVATLHAYSHEKIKELDALHAPDAFAQGSRFVPEEMIGKFDSLLADSEFVSKTLGLSDEELDILKECMSLVEQRPDWVKEWDYVCVNRDFSVDNTAIRETAHGEELVSFDWGASYIGLMEQDVEVLLFRDLTGDDNEKGLLVGQYLDAYADLTNRRIELDVFMARIPWARLTVNLRGILEHMLSLHWMPWQSRSVFFVHLFTSFGPSLISEIRKNL